MASADGFLVKEFGDTQKMLSSLAFQTKPGSRPYSTTNKYRITDVEDEDELGCSGNIASCWYVRSPQRRKHLRTMRFAGIPLYFGLPLHMYSRM